MGAIISSIISNLLEVIIFSLIAFAGILLGKKFRDSKTSGKEK